MNTTGEEGEPTRGRAYGVPARRVRIVQLLTEAYARDELEQKEFERRIELAEQASTIEELDELVADFPGAIVSASAANQPSAARSGVPVTGAELENELARINSIPAPARVNVIGDQRITIAPGDPPALQSISLLGDTTVDLRELEGASGVFLVKVAAVLGDTRILVSRGTPVDLRLVGVLGDQKHVRRGSGRWRKIARKLGFDTDDEAVTSAPGPTVVVTGFKLLGDTEVVEE